MLIHMTKRITIRDSLLKPNEIHLWLINGEEKWIIYNNEIVGDVRWTSPYDIKSRDLPKKKNTCCQFGGKFKCVRSTIRQTEWCNSSKPASIDKW